MREITKLVKAMELLRQKISKELPIQHIVLLLKVAEKPGITMPELSDVLDMPQGTVSRNVKVLSHYGERTEGQEGKPSKFEVKGYDLLRVEPDMYNRKSLAVYLTKKGEEIVEKFGASLFSGNKVMQDIKGTAKG